MGLMSDQETASALFDEVARLRAENERLRAFQAALRARAYMISGGQANELRLVFTNPADMRAAVQALS